MESNQPDPESASSADDVSEYEPSSDEDLDDERGMTDDEDEFYDFMLDAEEKQRERWNASKMSDSDSGSHSVADFDFDSDSDANFDAYSSRNRQQPKKKTKKHKRRARDTIPSSSSSSGPSPSKKQKKRATNDSGPVVCDVCDKVFQSTTRLSAHAKRHRVAYQCLFCDMRFVTKHELKFHTAQHTGAKEFFCGYCRKPFARHETHKSHEDSKCCLKKRFDLPYPCPDPVCGATFSSRDRRDRHLSKWHKPNAWRAHPPLEKQRALLSNDRDAKGLAPPTSTLWAPHPELPFAARRRPMSRGASNDRRPRSKWTDAQVDAFKKGILRFGERGGWKRILYVYHDKLQGRTSCDLKDKWRMLKRVENLPFIEVDSTQAHAQLPPVAPPQSGVSVQQGAPYASAHGCPPMPAPPAWNRLFGVKPPQSPLLGGGSGHGVAGPAAQVPNALPATMPNAMPSAQLRSAMFGYVAPNALPPTTPNAMPSAQLRSATFGCVAPNALPGSMPNAMPSAQLRSATFGYVKPNALPDTMPNAMPSAFGCVASSALSSATPSGAGLSSFRGATSIVMVATPSGPVPFSISTPSGAVPLSFGGSSSSSALSIPTPSGAGLSSFGAATSSAVPASTPSGAGLSSCGGATSSAMLASTPSGAVPFSLGGGVAAGTLPSSVLHAIKPPPISKSELPLDVQAAIKQASVPTETDLNAQAVANLRRGPRNRFIMRGTVVSDDDNGDEEKKSVKIEGDDAKSSSVAHQNVIGSGAVTKDEKRPIRRSRGARKSMAQASENADNISVLSRALTLSSKIRPLRSNKRGSHLRYKSERSDTSDDGSLESTSDSDAGMSSDEQAEHLQSASSSSSSKRSLRPRSQIKRPMKFKREQGNSSDHDDSESNSGDDSDDQGLSTGEEEVSGAAGSDSEEWRSDSDDIFELKVVPMSRRRRSNVALTLRRRQRRQAASKGRSKSSRRGSA